VSEHHEGEPGAERPEDPQSARATIEPTTDGPFIYTPGDAGVLRDMDGSLLEVEGDVALCRCGGSSDKPFCDGTHRTNGFSSARRRPPGVGRTIDYPGLSITIHDNRAVCAHAGYCFEGLPAVFDEDRRSWIDPDAAPAEAIIAICEKCPSGALSYTIEGVRHTDLDRPPAVAASDRGPLCTEGGVEVVGEPLAEGVSAEHRTLCRCGASRNKPLCDGSHRTSGFLDAIG